MMRSNRWLAACLSLSLSGCGTGALEPSEAPRAEASKTDASQTEGRVLTSDARLQDIATALSVFPDVQVLGSHPDGVPYMIHGELGGVGQALAGVTAWQAHALVSPALERIAPSFRLDARDLVPQRISRDAQGRTHLRYAQTKEGLSVLGGELVVHLDASGQVYAVNGSARDGEQVSSKPGIAPEAAQQVALRKTPGASALEGVPRLVYVRATEKDSLRLAWEVRVTGKHTALPLRDRVYVDAMDTAIVLRVPEIHALLNRKVYSANNGTSLPGTLRRSEGQGATGDAYVDSHFDVLGTTYDCFSTLFGRDSYDDAGHALSSTVHYSNNYVNAFWDGTQLVCGDGDGVNSGPLCTDLDVVVHELTHAVTDFESGLVYAGESGALSESLSDIFAATCESWTTSWSTGPDVWKIGEDIWTPATPNDALRYMDDPALDGASLDSYEDYSSSTDVHYGSGIPNLAFKLLATGGVHPRGRSTIEVPGIGVEAAARIFYKANTDYFTSSTTFEQAKTYTEYAAQALGYSAAVVESVSLAWQVVYIPLNFPVFCTTLPPFSGTVTNLSGVLNSNRYYCASAGAYTTTLFTIGGGTGDADLYVRFGAAPTKNLYDCRPFTGGNTEVCTVTARPTAGKYWIMINAYRAYSGVTFSYSF
ncbi:M4 family metallopeptidase [Myxococcus sp. K15C18031901]|uniref:M4 family metallopeptidase n=1 Tax=Myxococcus dinghuensis TaxID=2906761 RepID=UPI0020A82067|nr:M4 family metallopeptidase [Myxococcus dinghuensis]MCP3100047.1 M4 family metallopeptidase [Myxococcus dinghuensis]